ncbi:MAG: transglutaminase domain-containing protein [Lachnospiraceae bacterium]|nr:transglutaminase domain-containing protein [Lachnospiraceae bacterium]
MKRIITLITMLIMGITGLNVKSEPTQMILDKTEISTGIASLKPIRNDETDEGFNKTNSVIIAEKNAAEEKKKKEEADRKQREEEERKQKEIEERRLKDNEEKNKNSNEINKTGNNDTSKQENNNTSKQGESIDKPQINPGNNVSFNKIKAGMQVEDLDDSLLYYAGEILNLINGSPESEVILDFDWTYDEYQTVITAIENTYFKYTGTIHTSYSAFDTEEYRLQITPTRENLNRNKEMENLIANAVNSCVFQGISERDAVIAINNYVCNLITYDESYGDAYSAFTTGRGRCSSYSACVKAMCDYVGIECREIEGQANGSSGWELHAWNQVKIGGAWYYTDACWNDSTNNEYMFSSTLWSNHQI